jgi:diguanylate cyclase (GGDEF)-like protein
MAITMAESIRARVEGLNILHEYSTPAACVTISIGVASMMPNENNVSHSLITMADEALYTAKHRGRNRVCSAISEC